MAVKLDKIIKYTGIPTLLLFLMFKNKYYAGPTLPSFITVVDPDPLAEDQLSR